MGGARVKGFEVLEVMSSELWIAPFSHIACFTRQSLGADDSCFSTLLRPGSWDYQRAIA